MSALHLMCLCGFVFCAGLLALQYREMPPEARIAFALSAMLCGFPPFLAELRKIRRERAQRRKHDAFQEAVLRAAAERERRQQLDHLEYAKKIEANIRD